MVVSRITVEHPYEWLETSPTPPIGGRRWRVHRYESLTFP